MSQKIDIDFSVSSNPYFLKVMDFSNWQLIENQPAIIEITLPGYTKNVTHYFDKYKVNIYNSFLLDLHCKQGCEEEEKLTLPDGIYKIKVIGSPSKYSKEYYYLKTDLVDMEIAKLFIANSKEGFNKELNDKITEIHFLIEGASAELMFDNIKQASIKFQQVLSLVEQMRNCKECNHV